MSKRRFFLAETSFQVGPFFLSRHHHAEELRHLRKVLRLNTGDVVELVNGKGALAQATIQSLSGEQVTLEITAVDQAQRARPRLQIAMGLLKGARMDWLIEKLVELGVDAIQPIATEFSVIDAEDGERRMQRWQRLAQAAAKQSSVLFMPQISAPEPFSAFLQHQMSDSTTLVYLHPDANYPTLWETLDQNLSETQEVLTLAIGPEGGFHPEEVLHLEKLGWRGTTLGSTILRGETAGIVAASIAQHFFANRRHRA